MGECRAGRTRRHYAGTATCIVNGQCVGIQRERRRDSLVACHRERDRVGCTCHIAAPSGKR